MVDFPAPFGPKKPTISPRAASKEMLLTAICSPKFLLKFSMMMDTFFGYVVNCDDLRKVLY